MSGHKVVRVGDIDVAYDEVGTRGAPETPLVLVHGLTGHRRDWETQREFLSECGWSLAPDLRGHGDSSHPEDPGTYSFLQLVADLEGFLDELGVEQVDLLGHSVGGMVGLRFVLAHPERVRSLVAMNTTCEAPRTYERWIFEKGGELGRSEGMAELQRRVETVTRQAEAQNPHDPSGRWPVDYWEHHRMRYLAMDPNAYEHVACAMLDQDPVTQRLGEIECPTLVVVGEHDVDYLVGAELIAAGVPRAEKVVIPLAGHHPHQENSAAWQRAVALHLQNVRGQRSS